MSTAFDIITAADSYRAATEDRVAVLDHPAGRVIVVADGVGGRSGAAAAAEAVVGAAGDAARGAADVADADAWCRVLADADRRIVAEKAAGETTAVVVGITPAGIGGASVGDSGAWLIAADGFRDLTRGGHRKPYLGWGAALPIPFRERWPQGGVLLVATDGLLKYASPESICGAARGADLSVAARALIDLARLRSGTLQDDVALALCRVHPHD